jgi:hypothetical protein
MFALVTACDVHTNDRKWSPTARQSLRKRENLDNGDHQNLENGQMDPAVQGFAGTYSWKAHHLATLSFS